MKAPDKDRRILAHIISYCDQINMAVERFGKSYDIFPMIPFTATLYHSASCKSVNSSETCPNRFG